MSTAYPEHEKMRPIADKSNVIGEFLQWCGDEKGTYLVDMSDYRGDGIAQPWLPLLYEFFEIDPVKIEAEKRAMLEEMRRNLGDDA